MDGCHHLQPNLLILLQLVCISQYGIWINIQNNGDGDGDGDGDGLKWATQIELVWSGLYNIMVHTHTQLRGR